MVSLIKLSFFEPSFKKGSPSLIAEQVYASRMADPSLIPGWDKPKFLLKLESKATLLNFSVLRKNVKFFH